MAVTEAEKYRSLLPTDRNPHWLQNGIVWDNSGTNWQLQFCLSFVFLFLFLFVWLYLKIANHDIKRERCCHIVCFPNVTFRCSAVTLYFSDSKNSNSCAGYAHACRHIHTDLREDTCAQANKHIKQHQTVSKWKSVSFMDCVMLQIIFYLVWHGSDFLRQCRSDWKTRFWYLAWQLHSN